MSLIERGRVRVCNRLLADPACGLVLRAFGAPWSGPTPSAPAALRQSGRLEATARCARGWGRVAELTSRAFSTLRSNSGNEHVHEAQA